MSEKLFKFLLTELNTVRVTCTRRQCGWTVEVPLEKLPRVASSKCPVCGEMFDPEQMERNPLTDLRDAVKKVADLSGRMKVEFVLPDPE